MKKFALLLFMICIAISCTKTEYQQTRDSIKKADSLFTRANDGIKTLDSISKILNDSSKVNSEIRRQTTKVEKIIRDKSGSIDSLKVIIRKSGDRIGKSAETVKTLDSVQKVLRQTDDPFEVLSTISKTIDKVTKDTEIQPGVPDNNQNKNKNNTPRGENDSNYSGKTPDAVPTKPSPQITTAPDPMVKTGLIELSVNDLQAAEAQLRNEIRNSDGQIISEKLGEQAGEKRQVFVAEIPFQNFDLAANSISSNIGSIRTKAIEQSGVQYDPERISNLEIVLIQKINETAAAPVVIAQNTPADDSKQDSTAETVGKIVLSALPFLPILLILGLVWYFINRRNRRRNAALEAKRQEDHDRAVYEQQIKVQNTPRPTENTTRSNPPVDPSDETDPYEKYKPKY